MGAKALTKKKDFSDIINPDDFKSVRLHIGLNNLSTRTQLRDGKRIYEKGQTVTLKRDHNNKDLTIELVEFQIDGLVLDMPPNVCTVGHMLIMDFKTEGAKPNDAFFEVTGNVTSSETLSNGHEQVVFTFTKFKEDEWVQFQEVYAQRQKEILEFFNAVKG